MALGTLYNTITTVIAGTNIMQQLPSGTAV